MKQTGLLILNTLTLVAALIFNYISGTGNISEYSVGEVSAMYETLFKPAGYAFSIWGLIYLLLIAFVGHQWYAWYKKREDYELKSAGFWFAFANIANMIWIFTWLNLLPGLSLLVLLILLFSLIMLMFRLKLEIWDAPVRHIFFVWWPICIYLGWVITATLANAAAYIHVISSAGSFFTSEFWTALLILVAVVVYSLLIRFRNMREAALVGVWALSAITVKQWGEYDLVAYAAVAGAVILFIYAGYHGYKNRKTSPIEKLRRTGSKG